MPREKENYRDTLEHISGFFPNRNILTIKDVAAYTGKDPRWCKKTYNIDPKKGISVVSLAKAIS